MRHSPSLLILIPALLFACAGDKRSSGVQGAEPLFTIDLPAPRAEVRPQRLKIHGDLRIDDYYWLREREDPQVLAYLEAENAYTSAFMEHTEPLQQELFEELRGRVELDDSSVPYRLGDYLYYTRTEEGKQYPLHCRKHGRKHGNLEAPEEIMLDGDAMAEGHGYFSLSRPAVSPEQDRIAYGIDTRGRRFYTLEVRELSTGEVSDRIPGVTGNVVWAEDGRTIFYARQDPDTLRTYQIWRHRLGSPHAKDVLVYEEQDETFSCRVSKTRSKRFLMITSRQTLATEVRILDSNDPLGTFRTFLPRQRNHEYQLEHHGEHFYVRTNWKARNFRLMRTPVFALSRDDWTEVIPHRRDVLLQRVEMFQDHMVVQERKDGLVHISVHSLSNDDIHEIAFEESAYRVGTGPNPEFESTVLRLRYSSMVTPNSVYDYDMVTQERELLKRDKLLDGFDPENYATERLWAEAADGQRIPISIVYRRGFPRDGSRPLLLYGYGSYGASMDASFSADRLSLLDRGFAYAIAHVRGGQELGRYWYEQGKLLQKRNTFTDFIACAEHLIAEGYTTPRNLYAMGGSAGGLLMGAVANMRPDLFHGIVAAVPFVDVVTTMLDSSIPLTTSEYDEWGNPNNSE
ncbi:MAG: S9 family peptidase, partial [Planctomycetota bacterium]